MVQGWGRVVCIPNPWIGNGNCSTGSEDLKERFIHEVEPDARRAKA